jgi:hypothetical protein
LTPAPLSWAGPCAQQASLGGVGEGYGRELDKTHASTHVVARLSIVRLSSYITTASPSSTTLRFAKPSLAIHSHKGRGGRDFSDVGPSHPCGEHPRRHAEVARAKRRPSKHASHVDPDQTWIGVGASFEARSLRDRAPQDGEGSVLHARRPPCRPTDFTWTEPT